MLSFINFKECFMDITDAISAAYQTNQFQGHKMVCSCVNTPGHYVVSDKNAIPPGYKRLTTNELVSLTKTIPDNITAQDSNHLSEAFSFMANRKITKEYQGAFGFLRKFFDALSNLFKGHGFISTAGRALERSIQLKPKSFEVSKLSESKNKEEQDDPYAYRARIFKETFYSCKYGYSKDGKAIFIDNDSMIKETKAYVSEPTLKLKERIENAVIDLVPPLSLMKAGIKGLSKLFSATKAETIAPLTSMGLFKKHKTEFNVVNDDTLNVMLHRQELGEKPCGINMANAHVQGGGVERGCPAQEEAVCRRTNLIVSLRSQRHEYSLKDSKVIYSPNVSVFREDENSSYKFMDMPKKVSIISVAAIDLRPKSTDYPQNGDVTYEGLKKNDWYMKTTADKIRTFLRVAKTNGHDTLVLGALGCGAFQNPPKLVAKIFKKIFKESEFKGQFKRVDFAILRQNDRDKDNIDAFTGICRKLNS